MSIMEESDEFMLKSFVLHWQCRFKLSSGAKLTTTVDADRMHTESCQLGDPLYSLYIAGNSPPPTCKL